MSRNRPPFRPELYFGDHKLDIYKKNWKILGLPLTSNLRGQNNIGTLSRKTDQKLSALRNVASKLDSEGRTIVYKAQMHSVLEYASLSWVNASSTNLGQLENINKKTLNIIGIDVHDSTCKCSWDYSKCTLQDADQPMSFKTCSPTPHERRRATCTSESMPKHALSLPHGNTCSHDRSYLYTSVKVRNSLPPHNIGTIADTRVQALAYVYSG